MRNGNINSILLDKFKLYSDIFLTDPVLFFKEIRRKINKREYMHNGINVKNSSTFGLLYRLKKYKDEWEIIKENSELFLINKRYNIKFWIPKDNIGIYNTVLAEKNLYLEQYKITKEDVYNKKILDVGAYVGDTVIGFVLKGAKYIVGVEPVYYEIARKNLEINNIKNAEIREYGLADKEFSYGVDTNLYSGTGLKEGNFLIKTKSWEDLLKNKEFDLAKIDCEGCEYYLLTLPDNLLRKIPIWIIEIHGVYLPLINKFRRAGFKVKMIKNIGDFVAIWRFEL